jgi:1-acyl-sn-glycerol-3-phosphate acyltransferase
LRLKVTENDLDAAHRPTLLGRFLRGRRKLSKRFLHWFFHTHVRLIVEGLEHIPETGPVLVLPNHLSNLDGPLILGVFPHNLEMVGPGDFKVEPMKLAMMKMYGMTLIKRGYSDRSGMSAIMHHLKKGRSVLMFPSGGMWEKRRFENKAGALYFSQLTGTPIIPAGISGGYLKGRSAFFFGKPRIVLKFGSMMPAISHEGGKTERAERLEAASAQLADRIFELLEPDEQEQYRRWMREVYSFEFEYDGSRTAPDMPTLAQFVHKPNLFRPMWKHAKKDMDPFRKNRFYPVRRTRASAEAMKENLEGNFDHYIPYRLGDEAHSAILKELDLFLDFCDELSKSGVKRIKCLTIARDPLTGEKRRRQIQG